MSALPSEISSRVKIHNSGFFGDGTNAQEQHKNISFQKEQYSKNMGNVVESKKFETIHVDNQVDQQSKSGGYAAQARAKIQQKQQQRTKSKPDGILYSTHSQMSHQSLVEEEVPHSRREGFEVGDYIEENSYPRISPNSLQDLSKTECELEYYLNYRTTANAFQDSEKNEGKQNDASLKKFPQAEVKSGPIPNRRALNSNERATKEQINEKNIKSEKDLLIYSRKSRAVEYEPFTLSDWKKTRPREYYQLGKLQPDLNSPELEAKRVNAARIREYSEKIEKSKLFSKKSNSKQRDAPSSTITPTDKSSSLKIHKEVLKKVGSKTVKSQNVKETTRTSMEKKVEKAPICKKQHVESCDSDDKIRSMEELYRRHSEMQERIRALRIGIGL